MNVDKTIDFANLERLIEWHIQEGTDGLVILGSTGEFATILSKEREQIIRYILQRVRGRCPVIVGAGHNNTQIAIELTREAMELGADAALIVTPYYNKPPQEGLYQHFTAIAKVVPLPIILYNVPSRTGCDLLPETAIRLSRHTNIIGIKEATGKIERVHQILQATQGKMDCYSGDDNTAAEFMLAGGKGTITVAGNVVPKLMHELCSAAIIGERDKTKQLDQTLQLLFHAMGVETNPIPAKFALHEMGMIEEGIRLPLTWLNSKYHDEVRSALKGLGLVNKETVI